MEKISKDIGGNQENLPAYVEVWEVRDRSRRKDENMSKPSAKVQGEIR